MIRGKLTVTYRPSRRIRRTRRPLIQRLLVLCLGLSVAVAAGYVLSQGAPDWNLTGMPEPPTSRSATVATDVLNVREAPTTDSAVLDSLVDGESIEVVGEPESGFVPVAYDGGRAWIAQEYLSYDDATHALTVNPLPVLDVSAASVPDEPVEKISEPVEAAREPHLETEDIPPEEDVVAQSVEPGERWIDIDRSEAIVTLYEGSVSIASFTGRIGRDPAPDGFYSTAVGTFHVYSLNKGLAPTPFAGDTWLTDWVGFDPERKNGIHSPVRDAQGVEKAWQNPATLGCVRLNANAAVAVFDFAEIGMRVEVHD